MGIDPQILYQLASQLGGLSASLAPAGSNLGELGRNLMSSAQSGIQGEATKKEKEAREKEEKGGLFGSIGSALGTVGGAALGSLVPGVGTALGSTLGGTLGSAAGGTLGSAIGGGAMPTGFDLGNWALRGGIGGFTGGGGFGELPIAKVGETIVDNLTPGAKTFDDASPYAGQFTPASAQQNAYGGPSPYTGHSATTIGPQIVKNSIAHESSQNAARPQLVGAQTKTWGQRIGGTVKDVIDRIGNSSFATQAVFGPALNGMGGNSTTNYQNYSGSGAYGTSRLQADPKQSGMYYWR